MVGNLVAGKRIAQASGRDLGQIEENDLVRKVSDYGIYFSLLNTHPLVAGNTGIVVA